MQRSQSRGRPPVAPYRKRGQLIVGATPRWLPCVNSLLTMQITKDTEACADSASFHSCGHQPPDTAKSCGRLPSLLPPFGVMTIVSPQVQRDSLSAEIADGLQIKTMFSCSVTASWRGLLA